MMVVLVIESVGWRSVAEPPFSCYSNNNNNNNTQQSTVVDGIDTSIRMIISMILLFTDNYVLL